MTTDTDYPDIPLPQAATNTGDVASITGFTCGDAWSMLSAGELSESGPDHLLEKSAPSTHRTPISGTNPPTLCTLWESSSKHIQIRLDYVNSRVQMVVTSGGVVSTANLDASSFTNEGRVQEIFFLRGSPVLLGVTCDGEGGTTTYTLYASVGGTVVAKVLRLHTGPLIKPTQLRFGGPSHENPESAYWYGFKVETTTTLTESQVKGHLQNLDFFLVGGTVTPPGGDV